LRFDNCSLRCGSTGVNGRITIGGGGTYVEWNNTTVSFANASQAINVQGLLRWRNTPSALLGTIPAFLFAPMPTRGGLVECIGVDFSAAGSGKTIVGTNANAASDATVFRFTDCKFNASV